MLSLVGNERVERHFPLRTFVFLALWVPTVSQAYQWTEDPGNKERVAVGPYELLPVVDFLREQGPGQGKPCPAGRPGAAAIRVRICGIGPG